LVQSTSRPGSVARPKIALAGAAARPQVLEVAAPVAALPHGGVAAEQDRRHQAPSLRRLRVDPLADQSPQHERPLRVADEHNAAAPVEAGQVRSPRLQDVGVGLLEHLRRDRLRL
jgi:hypothetical protein